MSGTSLDGVDLVCCSFDIDSTNFSISHSNTFPYNESWKKRLKKAHELNAYELSQLDSDLSKHFSDVIMSFITANKIEDLDAIASHGHTVFHQPSKKFTLQIANPAYISALTGYKVIGDFRSSDVVLGGQGAPLVPIGDRDLFSSYTNRLNLGGFANISFEKNGVSYAYDICPVNMPLNEIATLLGSSYDKDGLMAQQGKINNALLDQLNTIAYYRKGYPKSLGIEWYNRSFRPFIQNSDCSNKDKLRTIVEHISIQISNSFTEGNVLISGGGAHNSFLIDRIHANCSNEIILPDNTVIDYKEALIFAYLGHLRLLTKINVLASVTGALKDHCAGSVHLP